MLPNNNRLYQNINSIKWSSIEIPYLIHFCDVALRWKAFTFESVHISIEMLELESLTHLQNDFMAVSIVIIENMNSI